MDMILIISLKTTAEIEITEQYVLRATSQTRFIGFFVKRDYVLSLQFIAMECVNIFFFSVNAARSSSNGGSSMEKALN